MVFGPAPSNPPQIRKRRGWVCRPGVPGSYRPGRRVVPGLPSGPAVSSCQRGRRGFRDRRELSSTPPSLKPGDADPAASGTLQARNDPAQAVDRIVDRPTFRRMKGRSLLSGHVELE